jgi:hypothetical protein
MKPKLTHGEVSTLESLPHDEVLTNTKPLDEKTIKKIFEIKNALAISGLDEKDIVFMPEG